MQLQQSLAQVTGAIDRKRRLDVRNAMRRETASVQDYVIESCIDYRQELKVLEAENKRLKTSNTLLAAQNQALLDARKKNDELLTFHRKVLKQARRAQRPNKECALCDHPLACQKSLCVYCQQWMCQCCRRWCNCKGPCTVTMCKQCSAKEQRECPKHNAAWIESERGRALMTYYEEHKYDSSSDEESSSE